LRRCSELNRAVNSRIVATYELQQVKERQTEQGIILGVSGNWSSLLWDLNNEWSGDYFDRFVVKATANAHYYIEADSTFGEFGWVRLEQVCGWLHNHGTTFHKRLWDSG
jgi:hypothetical protein